MSKYIKLEDIEMLINACEWRMTLAKERHGEGFVDYSKQVLDVDELTKRLSDLPIIEVSRDCISRACLIEKLKDNKAFIIQAWNNDFSIMADIDKSRVDELDSCIGVVMNAPSVVPSRGSDEE